MNLNEFLEALIKSNHEAEEDCDYETLAFDAGVEYAVKKIKAFLNTETKEEKIVTLPEYLKALNALSQNRKDKDFEDRDISWEEAGYQEALFDIREYLDDNEVYIKDILDEYKELED